MTIVLRTHRGHQTYPLSSLVRCVQCVLQRHNTIDYFHYFVLIRMQNNDFFLKHESIPTKN